MSKLHELNDIIQDKLMEDGDMWFRCSWKGYDSTHNSWEPASSFAESGLIFSYWLEKTDTNVPVASDIELGVSEVEEGGYMVKRQGMGDKEHEWLPEEMIPDHLLDQYHDFEDILDKISDNMNVYEDEETSTDDALDLASQATPTAVSLQPNQDSPPTS